MAEIDKEQRDRYFGEIGLQLRRAGFETGAPDEWYLPVTWEGTPLCRVTGKGSVQYNEADIAGERREAFHHVLDIRDRVTEYMRRMENGPRVEATGLHEDYRLLAEYNGIVLAGHKFNDAPGHQFTTWERSYDRTGVAHGNYTDNYAAAKQDFATRSGLVQTEHLFSDEQLAETYRCILESLDSDDPITPEREKILKETAEQIERAVPDLEQRVELSNQKELVYGEQLLQGPEMG